MKNFSTTGTINWHTAFAALALAALASAVGVEDIVFKLLFLAPLLVLFAFSPFYLMKKRLTISTNIQLFLPCFICIAFLAISIFWSSWKYASYYFFFILSSIPLIAALLTIALEEVDTWRRLKLGILVVSTTLSVIAIYQHFYTSTRPSALFSDPNILASFLNLALIPHIANLAASKGRHLPFGQSVVVAALSAAILATQSRAGVWLFALAVIFLFLIFYVAKLSTGRKLLQLGACIVFAWTAITALPTAHTEHLTNYTPLERMSKSHGLSTRLDMWESTAKMYLERPIFGWGLGTYKQTYPAYRLDTERATSGDFAHNDFLQFTMETGIGGALLSLLFIYLIVRQWLKSIFAIFAKTENQPPEIRERETERLGLLTALGALIVHATVNFELYVPAICVLTGIYMGKCFNRCIPDNLMNKKIPFIPGILATLFSTALFAIFFVDVLVSRNLVTEASQRELRLDSDDYTLAVAADYLSPLNHLAVRYRALAEYKAAKSLRNTSVFAGIANTALESTNDYFEIKSRDCEIRVVRGELLALMGTNPLVYSSQAREQYWQAIENTPTCLIAYLKISEELYRNGEVDIAISVMEKAVAKVFMVNPRPQAEKIRTMIVLAQLYLIKENYNGAIHMAKIAQQNSVTPLAEADAILKEAITNQHR